MNPFSLPHISVFNRQRKIAFDRGALEKFARRAVPLCASQRGAGLSKLAHVDVVVVSDRKISALHREFLGIDGPTDVITFQHGEIFISVETARRQAKPEGTTLFYELRLYLVHGLLHLQGFDDLEEEERTEMAALQERIVASLLPADRFRR